LDADWVGCIDDRRWTEGFAIYLEENLVLWSAKKQLVLFRSSIQTQYTLANGTAEVIWVEIIMNKLGIVQHKVWICGVTI
jgi:hypothetical protein